MKKYFLGVFIVLTVLIMGANLLFAAIGCTLNDPDRDIRRIFPRSTGYKTDFVSIEEKGGKPLFEKIEAKLGDKLETIYEPIDTPYAQYTVLRGIDVVGYIHGVNQKGTYGGMQLILATDTDGKIIAFYYQKISSPESKLFRKKKFTDQFIGLTLEDFYKGDLKRKIEYPSEKSYEDFIITLRGLKKNLILLDEFKLNNVHDKYIQVEAGE